MIPKIQGSQRDFSAGELDVSMKRADDNPIMKAGARQLSNWRILNSKGITNRPGRTALFLEQGRVEELRMSPTNTFYIAFGSHYLKIYNEVGAQVFTSALKGDGVTAIPWTLATVKNIVWAADSGNRRTIYIAYGDDAPENVPQVLSWDGVSQVSTWTLETYTEMVTSGGQKRTPFYRISPQDITMLPSAVSGNINITFSGPVLDAGMIGTFMRWCGREIRITGVTTSQIGMATVIERLPPSQEIEFAAGADEFNIGDAVVGDTSGAKGIVTANTSQQILTFFPVITSGFVTGDAVVGGTSGATATVISSVSYWGVTLVTVLLSTATPFVSGEMVTGPHGNAVVTVAGDGGGTAIAVQILPSATGSIAQFVVGEVIAGPSSSGTTTVVTVVAPTAVTIWDNEIMNSFHGYPFSVFFDQVRLGFCNFPALPSGIAWSAISLPLDLYVGALPGDAIFELAPNKSQVLFVAPGPESSEFVFCDNGLFYIPITAANPLLPGSVEFKLLTRDGCAEHVQPRGVQELILWVNAGLTSVLAVVATGAYNRPYEVSNLSELHAHLFNTPIGIAVPSTTDQFEERYAYVLNANGTIAVGKYNVAAGQIKGAVGWLPWSGGGTATWVSALGSNVLFTSAYGPNGITTVGVVERLDATQYLDSAMFVNAAPAAFAPPFGKGPLWWLAGGTVELIDMVTRMMGTYVIDANGFIVPLNNGGENLLSPYLVAGQMWTATFEPFVPDAQPGQDLGQRMKKRRVARMAVYAVDSTGFVMARLFSGPITTTSPPLGTIMNTRRVPTWNQGDDPTQPPPLREEVERWRPLGRAFDPRVAVIKDTPGPLEIPEIGIEASI